MAWRIGEYGKWCTETLVEENGLSAGECGAGMFYT